MAINHKDLVIGYEKVHGGGWWQREYRDYTFYYAASLNKSGRSLNLSKAEWL